MYTPEEKDKRFAIVCQRIADGESLRNICKGENAPISTTVFFDLVRNDEEKNKQYARACELRAEVIFDEIIEIADESNADITISEEGKIRVDGEAIQRSRLKVDARKWVLGKLNPKKYGDKVEVENNHTIKEFDIKKALGFDRS